MTFNVNTKLGELYDYFAPDGEMLLSSVPSYFSDAAKQRTIMDVHNGCPTWSANDMVYGLNRLAELHEKGLGKWYPLCNESEIAEDPQNARVKLLYCPADKRQSDIFYVLCAGGGYGSVCTMGEALQVAADVNRLGYDAFCVNYRTYMPSYQKTGLLPRPVDDLAKAMKFINDHTEIFGLDIKKAVVGGFSAGGHLALTWGQKHIGAAKYGLPQPLGLLPIYPLVTMKNHMGIDWLVGMFKGMYGENCTIDDDNYYNACLHIGADFPPVFIARAEDDTTISPKDGDDLIAALKDAGIPFEERKGPTGGHGFGLGTETSMKGYVEDAVRFFDKFAK